jgi:hypothetical protein
LMCWYASMSDQRIGTATVCLTGATLPYAGPGPPDRAAGPGRRLTRRGA